MDRKPFERLGDRIAALFSSPQQGSEVRQAVIDMFFEKQSKAFEWLTQISCVYVMMSSLGFEAFSNEEVMRVLRSFSLVADSDVVISLLCEGEGNHQEILRIVNG